MKEDSYIFGTSGASGIPRARARFLAQAIQLEEHPPSAIIRASIYFMILILIAAIIWAWSTKISEVTIAIGEVVPAGLIHDVQHLEGGIVKQIKVRNGDQIKSGDLLLQFSPPALQSEHEQTLIRKTALELEAERLQALIEHRPPQFTHQDDRYLNLASKQQAIYLAQLDSQENELKVVEAQIRQRHTELTRQQHQAESIEKELSLLEEQVKIRSQLTKDQIVARTELLSTQSRLAEAESERRTIYDSVIVARSAWQEAKQRRLELLSRFNKESELKAGEVAAELAEVNQALIRLQDRVTRLDVHAPVDGIVQGLSITRINAVVEPGQVIMQIVPIDDELIVEARISPQEIGHIHPGQQAEVKIDSYDSARFGSVQGKIKQISASTYLDENREPYYRAEIELEKSWVGEQLAQMRIIPGMTVQANVMTGSKTILDYMLKPISRGFDSAFRER
ncbi:MAG: HlyD family type I secretion periplasmic adaptor subunit [gamma proteobacterium endosymbiont of Lamellibrachia anaximandri]|nr:HlyD family type I secretion periplasmic adaptor subunit [gamma proteobacterium endosymbiont of Lamellibrachia anaximandri]MBL3535601.1 HlyD family type I secretion periplasmic adaptor subunit [gamma proteobacterium endosymbiont of Lamellibrachia anaximandri]